MKASLEYWPAEISVPNDRRSVATSPEGVASSLAQIYDEHFHFVWRNARRLGVPEASADDVVQDVFIVVHRRFADFDGRVPVRAWIFGILVRVVGDHRRSFRRKRARWVPFEDRSVRDLSSAKPAPTPSDLAERAERVRLLETLFESLDEEKRLLLVLAELEQWTLREIAELLGSNINTIHSRLRAAKQAFEKVYARWLADSGETP